MKWLPGLGLHIKFENKVFIILFIWNFVSIGIGGIEICLVFYFKKIVKL